MELTISIHKTFFFYKFIYCKDRLIIKKKLCTIFQKVDIFCTKMGVFIYYNSIKNINSHIILKGGFTI